ncbi:hypothetical protein NPS01_25300 [Nocardioides psychrotolerans]|uniref:DUF7352 domain-containing protein n=1 Tax=Nocardioides psychrotolerans TaxID=1005945 RepID=A0A1I3LN30_9ACTN|nr:hypothetical protein [Nocardioides psychrotolerans]GEP38867.1 hypothetical protein NPS01_25300 [Nocardioides psychrotolerans]SFI86103.1 hypothetical protein SAMN05216561_11434 [Nocardioides psychrotolerans]
MKVIHKYVLTEAASRVTTHEGARFIHAANQYEQITVWAEVNTLERECTAELHVVGTGGGVPPRTRHVGSVLMADGAYVFHVYAPEETR